MKGIRTAAAVAASYGYTCAVLSGGAVQCWGGNFHGQLGNGTNRDASTPVRVKGIRTATAVTAANDHTCALLSDKTARCWGYNLDGQLGNGTSEAWDSEVQVLSTPVPVKAIRTATAISAGSVHTCALVSHGRVTCWGGNASGQLGKSPVRVSGIPVVVEGP